MRMVDNFGQFTTPAKIDIKTGLVGPGGACNIAWPSTAMLLSLYLGAPGDVQWDIREGCFSLE